MSAPLPTASLRFASAGSVLTLSFLWSDRGLAWYALAWLAAMAPSAQAIDDVAGTLFTLTNTPAAPNGVWSWFEDERGIVDATDPNNPLLLVSSVSAGPSPENGDIDLLWRNLATGTQGVFELSSQLEQDDHNSAALYLRPDGRYLAMYAKHGTDPLTRWRISTNPNDPTSWGPEQVLNNAAGATYNNTYYLPDDNNGAGRTYNFTRTVNYDPNIQVSNDHGTTWSNVGKLLTEGGGGDRPYLRYAGDGKKIHFIATDRHPRNFQNSVFHGYIQDGVLYNSDGSIKDGNLFDSTAVSPSALTQVFKNGSQFNGVTMNRAWTINLEIDNTGNPVGIISARANDSNQDHRFLYARFDGLDWRVNEMARAGGFLYPAEDDYTGLASIDPSNPNVVYMSSDIDPRDNSGTNKYELYKGFSSDFGATWAWTPITENSTIDNIRPVVPEFNGKSTVVTWLRGDYNSYFNWSTEVVGLSFDAIDPKSLLWRGDSADPTAWDEGVSSNWDSGGGVSDVFLDGAEVAFDDSAASFSVELPANVAPMRTVFNNNNSAYTVSGPGGIAGSGPLRVIGGGTATLASGNHTYTGDTQIARGTLALSGGATLSGTGHIQVGAGGTLDVSAAGGGYYTLSGQKLTVSGNVTGNVVATSNSIVELNGVQSFNGDLTATGSMVAGAGTISGSLTAESGATVRVGGAGLTVFQGGGSMNGVDDFESYSVGNANPGGSNAFNVNGGPWTSNIGSQTGLVAVNGGGSTLHLAFGWNSGQRGASRTGTTIADGDQGTYYFRMRTEDASPDVSFGLSDVASGSAFGYGDFEVQIGLVNNGGPTLGARNGGVFEQVVPGLSANTWYDIWLVVDNESDTYDAYYGTSGDPEGIAFATKFAEGFSFRNGAASNDLVSFMTLSNNHEDLNAHLDDVSFSALPPGPTVISGEATLFVEGDYAQGAGATLSLDLGNGDTYDRLVVMGTASLSGTLEVVLAEGAPAIELGDTFDILDFDAVIGDFDSYELPPLDAGLRWDVSNLTNTGSIAVAVKVEGDFNGDGYVDAADYSVWRDNKGAQEDAAVLADNGNRDSQVDAADYMLWKFGFAAAAAAVQASEGVAVVPEPTTVRLIGGALIALLVRAFATTQPCPSKT